MKRIYTWAITFLLLTLAMYCWSCSDSTGPSKQQEASLFYSHEYRLTEDWQFLSYPFADTTVCISLFPDYTALWAYDSGWEQPDTLYAGQGFWVKNSFVDSFTVTAPKLEKITFDLRSGWNVIGSLSQPVTLNNPELSEIYTAIDTSYFLLASIGGVIEPGKAYWVNSTTGEALHLEVGQNTNIGPAMPTRVTKDAIPEELRAPALQEEPQLYSHKYELVKDWQLCSYPFSKPACIDSLFPNKFAIWTYSIGWDTPDTLFAGEGFWLKNNSSDIFTFTAPEITEVTYHFPSAPSWSLIGSLSQPVILNNLELEAIWTYNCGEWSEIRHIGGVIEPGKAYWVRSTTGEPLHLKIGQNLGIKSVPPICIPDDAVPDALKPPFLQ